MDFSLCLMTPPSRSLFTAAGKGDLKKVRACLDHP
ncbi:MAG: hypothetical protein K0Q55_93 [Verrucomicrobia bacterium]|jgi:hypothetical protein|nr:hypothetical protein [Verrucomicrobiota bacterium]